MKRLQQLIQTHRWNSVKPSTRQSRQKQWKCYVRFCSLYKLSPIPCSVTQASYYIAFLGLYMKHSSIISYYQSVLFGHKLLGIEAPPISHPLLKALCLGILNTPSAVPVSKDPLRPADIRAMYKGVNMSSDIEVLIWAALLTMYRALLRVSHVTLSSHTLLRRDIEFQDWGVTIWIRSAKNLRLQAKGIPVPIVKGLTPEVCPVTWLRHLFVKFPRPPDAFLFSSDSWPFITYYVFQKMFKKFCFSSGITGNFASHSLRRGGASTLADLGVPLVDIKDRGLWSSDCVHKYLALSVARKRAVDTVFSSSL